MWQRRLWAGTVVTLLFGLAACLPAAPAVPAPAATAVVTNEAASAATATLRPTDTPASTPTARPTLTPSPPSTNTPTGAPTLEPALAATPISTSAPTHPPSPTQTKAAPSAIYFTVTPTTTLMVGAHLSMAWEAMGEAASLCFIDATGPVGCQDVPLKGSRTTTITEATVSHLQVGLQVSAAGTFTWSLVTLRFRCPEKEWFFENSSGRCAAAPAAHSRAAAQYFEHGFMVWTETPDRFYVFFDKDQGPDGPGWQQFLQREEPYPFTTPVPANATPPPGYYVPISGFGRIWRGEMPWGSVDVRGHLGWATGPEFAFDTAYQCEAPSHPKIWVCYIRGPDGRVLGLHPDSSAGVRLLWEQR